MGARGSPGGPEEPTAGPQTPSMTPVTAVTKAGPGPEPDASRLPPVAGTVGLHPAALSPRLGLRGSARPARLTRGGAYTAPPARGLQLTPGDGPLPWGETDSKVLPCRVPGEGGEGRHGEPGGRGTRAALRSRGSRGLVSPTREDGRPGHPGQGGGMGGRVSGPRSGSGGPGTPVSDHSRMGRSLLPTD